MSIECDCGGTPYTGHDEDCPSKRRTPAEPAQASTGRLSQDAVMRLMLASGIPESHCRMLYAGHGLTFTLEHFTEFANAVRAAPVAARELDVEAERREFEALIVPEWSRETEIDSDGDTVYVEDWMQGAFIGYQLGRAARSAAQSTAPAPSKMLDAQLRYIFELEQKVVALEAQVAAQPEVAPVSTEQAGDAWQPIETAPEDMKSCLYLVGGFCVQGFVDAGGVLNVQSEISPHWRKMRGKPTHWMPLPAAPSPNNSPVGADKEP